jgi:RimJ/RimL family protein N-acetyltransferase
VDDTREIRTARMTLVAATLEHVEAELAGRLGGLLGLDVPPGWPPGEYDRDAQDFFRERLRDEGPAAVGWYGWYALLRGDGGAPDALVGAGGYLGPPDAEGTVEIGYSILPEWEGRGLASELAVALAERALAMPTVTRVIAHTDAENAGSRAVLERAGLRPAGDGPIPGSLRYEREKEGKS